MEIVERGPFSGRESAREREKEVDVEPFSGVIS